MIHAAALVVALALAGGQSSGSRHSAPGEWVALFDGETLDGWVQRGGGAVYTVEEGAIVGETRPNTGNTFLCTEREYGDFVLEFEVKVHRELNSGCQIRSHVRENGAVYGYQVEIEAAPRGYSGGIYDENGRGWLAPPTEELAKSTPFRPDEWNRYRIEAFGDRFRTYINGVPIVELTDGETASGFIGLQVHGVGGRQDPIRVRWRDVRIFELR